MKRACNVRKRRGGKNCRVKMSLCLFFYRDEKQKSIWSVQCLHVLKTLQSCKGSVYSYTFLRAESSSTFLVGKYSVKHLAQNKKYRNICPSGQCNDRQLNNQLNRSNYFRKICLKGLKKCTRVYNTNTTP